MLKSHGLSDPCSFCPVRVCRRMECRELVTQVTEDSPNWGGWGKPEIRNCRKLLSFPGCKDGGRSYNTFQKLEPHLACPSGNPTAEGQKGGGNTTHPPHHLLPVLPTGQTQPSIRGASKHSCCTNRAGSRQEVHLRLTGPDLHQGDCFKTKPALPLGSAAYLLNNLVVASKVYYKSRF